MKLFFFDLETTGVNHWQHSIHQMSGKIVIDGEEKETFNFKSCPHPRARIEDEALKIANVTREQVLAYPPMGEVYKALILILSKYCNKFDKSDKFYLVGFNNASFDNQFLRAFFVQNADQYFGSWFWPNPVDVYVFATPYLHKDRTKMENFKLKTVAKHLGIEVDETKLHDALYDIHLTQQIFNKVVTWN
jgi:DNA polymerase-3 subunit epsilon